MESFFDRKRNVWDVWL